MSTELRHCKRCNRDLPLTSDNFYPRKDRPSGLDYTCKDCIRGNAKQRSRNYYHAHREQIRAKQLGSETKKAYMQSWHESHKDHDKEYYREYYPKVREHKLAYKKIYRERTKDQRREYSRLYRANNRDLSLKRMKNWRDRNVEHRKNYKVAHKQQCATHRRNRYARMKAAGGHHTVVDIQRQYKAQKGRCYWCECKLTDKYHVDHVIPIAKGGTNDASNLVIACPTCNQSKNDKYPWEWEGNNGKLF